LRSVRTALSVFESIARDQPIALTEIAGELALPTTTVHRALGTLNDAGWIRQVQPGRRWVVADRIDYIVGRRFSQLAERARPVLVDLRTRSAESSMYVVADGDQMVVLVSVDSTQALRVVGDEGARHPLHRLSTGKAVLAHWGDDEVLAYAERADIDGAELLAECNTTRRAGYAVNLGGWEPGIGSISVAVPGKGSTPWAGVGVFGPIDRFDGRVEPLAALVRHAARVLTGDVKQPPRITSFATERANTDRTTTERSA
jgi:IclR family acetate operon transcriptional repressor